MWCIKLLYQEEVFDEIIENLMFKIEPAGQI